MEPVYGSDAILTHRKRSWGLLESIASLDDRKGVSIGLKTDNTGKLEKTMYIWADKPPIKPGLWLYRLTCYGGGPAYFPDILEISINDGMLLAWNNIDGTSEPFSEWFEDKRKNGCGWQWAGPIVIAEPESKETTVSEKIPQWAIEEAHRIVCKHPWGWEESASDELTPDQEQHMNALASEIHTIVGRRYSASQAMSGLPDGLELWGLWIMDEKRWACGFNHDVQSVSPFKEVMEKHCTPENWRVRRYFPPEPEPPQHPLLAALLKANESLLWNAVAKPSVAEAIKFSEKLVAQNAEMRAMLEGCFDALSETTTSEITGNEIPIGAGLEKEIRELLVRVGTV